MLLEKQIDRISDIRLQMWPESKLLNIDQFDHLLAVLTEESGELRGAIRSFLGRTFSPEKEAFRSHLVEELGDVLVPIIAMSKQLEIPISEALDSAFDKLTSRLEKKKEEIRLAYILKKDADLPLKYIKDHQPLRYDVADEINNV
jgi:NTP pyrophosphatase (non-canonical NTP hydrolase)